MVFDNIKYHGNDNSNKLYLTKIMYTILSSF